MYKEVPQGLQLLPAGHFLTAPGRYGFPAGTCGVSTPGFGTGAFSWDKAEVAGGHQAAAGTLQVCPLSVSGGWHL